MADPYYYSSELLRQEGQRKALGQSRGFSPSDLNAILRANFQNQQQNEVTQRTLALNEKKANDEANAAKNAARASGIAGYTNIALQAPLAYRQYADIYKDWTKTATTTAKTGEPAIGGTTTQGSQTALSQTDGYATGTAIGSALPSYTPTSSSALPGYSPTTGAIGSVEQAGATAGSAGTTAAASEMTTGAAAGYGSLAGTAGYYVGSNLIHGKYSKVAGIAASTIAGAAAGGPVGAAAGLVVGVINAFF